jgi:hypothetical protein
MPLAHLRSLLSAVALAFACTLALPARATDYTDIWWTAGGTESGWGVNFVQNEDVLFATFYVYDTSKQPTWYSSPMYVNAGGTSYSGTLYSTTGSFFGGPWNQGDVSAIPAGTSTFTPTSTTTGTLTYTVNNVPGASNVVVTRNIERSKFRTIVLGGNYVGTALVTLAGCADSSRNGTTVYDINTAVAQYVGGTLTFDFVYIDYNNDTCTMTGASAQEGQLFRVPSAAYSCTLTTGINTTATLYEVKATALGIEGRWIASIDGGCQEDGRFTGLLQ